MSISISTQIPNQKAAKKKKKNEISREQHSKQANIRQKQEKMRGQRGTLPVQALGYVNSTKVILGLPETVGVHFLLRPHHYILKVITQFRNGGSTGKYANGSVFYGYIREK